MCHRSAWRTNGTWATTQSCSQQTLTAPSSSREDLTRPKHRFVCLSLCFSLCFFLFVFHFLFSEVNSSFELSANIHNASLCVQSERPDETGNHSGTRERPRVEASIQQCCFCGIKVELSCLSFLSFVTFIATYRTQRKRKGNNRTAG